MVSDEGGGRPIRRRERRGFFKHLLGEAIALTEELGGKPQLRLEDLPDLPDEKLAQVKPMMMPGREFVTTEEAVSVRSNETGALTVLLPLDRAGSFALGLFDGATELGDVAQRLAAELGVESEEAFARVRQVFLDLVAKGACVPSNPVW
jgi:hypothetical protein